MLIRNVPVETLDALKLRAKRRDRSVSAEVLDILENVDETLGAAERHDVANVTVMQTIDERVATKNRDSTRRERRRARIAPSSRVVRRRADLHVERVRGEHAHAQ